MSCLCLVFVLRENKTVLRCFLLCVLWLSAICMQAWLGDSVRAGESHSPEYKLLKLSCIE